MKRISRALYSLLVWKPDLSSLQRQSHKHVGCHMRSSNHGNWSICFNNGLVGILIWFVSLLCWCIKPGTGWDWLFGFFKSTAGRPAGRLWPFKCRRASWFSLKYFLLTQALFQTVLSQVEGCPGLKVCKDDFSVVP